MNLTIDGVLYLRVFDPYKVMFLTNLSRYIYKLTSLTNFNCSYSATVIVINVECIRLNMLLFVVIHLFFLKFHFNVNGALNKHASSLEEHAAYDLLGIKYLKT